MVSLAVTLPTSQRDGPEVRIPGAPGMPRQR